MLKVIDHGDVNEFAFSTRLSRAAGIKVSVFRIRGTLVDTGFSRVRDELATALESHPIDRAVVTHWHEDHSGNLGLLADRRIPTLVTPRTGELVPGTRSLPFYRWAIWGSPSQSPLPPTSDSLDLEIIPTPGHSEDHIALWDPSSETVFGGDLFLGVRACTIHPSEDPYATLVSVRRVLELRPKRFFDAHRGSIADPVGTLTAKADWLATALGEVERGLDRGDSDVRIRSQVLGGEDGTTWVSGGQMSKLNFVRAVRRARQSR